MIDQLIGHPFLWITLTLGFYLIGVRLQKKVQTPLLNPLLFSIIAIILVLLVFDLPYETYGTGGEIINLFVTPATVALAIKLEKNFIYLKKYYKAILTGIFSGVLFHTLMIFLFGWLYSYDTEMVATLFPKSITTAIAVGVSETMNGIVSLTVAVVIFTGIIGAVLAPYVFRLAKIDDPVAQGIATGSSAHAIGTTKAIEMGDVQGAMSGLAIVLTGIVIVLLAPLVEPIIQLLFG